GILVPDPAPALYVYEQEFTHGGRILRRRGLVCAVGLADYAEGTVLPHEETMSRPREDRLALLRACRASFSPILGLYRDPENRVAEAMGDLGDPVASFRDEGNHRHLLWRVADRDICARVRQLFAPLRLYIADGHHRYETALAYRNERLAARPPAPGSPPPAFQYAFMVLVNVYDNGLVILPTHRLVRPPATDLDRLLADLGNFFRVAPWEGPSPRRDGEGFARALAARAGGRDGARHFAAVLYAGGDRAWLLTLKEGLDPSPWLPAGRSPAWRSLDVVLLRYLVLERYLGLEPAALRDGSRVAYTHDPREAAAAVDRGAYPLAFLLNPTPVADLVAVAAAGERMPQKSTHFYPKLPAGPVIYAHDLQE
ncbi:MAG: DUF1015 domain-containing protein, partial [Firmicutes bacterium]|nr:DUF1015 domain-containing protein [Bacillota bacterium]